MASGAPILLDLKDVCSTHSLLDMSSSDSSSSTCLATTRGQRWNSQADFTPPWSWQMRVRHVLREVLVLAKLAIKLLGDLGLGWKWTFNFFRLILYAMVLLPGFMKLLHFYFFSKRVIRDISYGSKPRQQLDLYMPRADISDGERFPVIIYVTGGAWTIGYKGWGALLADRLSENGFIVACLDYRNFPQGNALEMIEDVNTGVAWVCDQIHCYGGDPNDISLCGQSAGAQLSLLALLKQVELSVTHGTVIASTPEWNHRSIRHFIGISGAFDLEGLADHLHRRGLYKSLYDKIMSIDGHPAYHELSPLHLAKALPETVGHSMPQILLIHGTLDKSVPYDGSIKLSAALQAAGAQSTCRLVTGKTHTSFLFEDPMLGGRDMLIDYITEALTGQARSLTYKQICPRPLCVLAGWISPF